MKMETERLTLKIYRHDVDCGQISSFVSVIVTEGMKNCIPRRQKELQTGPKHAPT
jgi:hypothetical protein